MRVMPLLVAMVVAVPALAQRPVEQVVPPNPTPASFVADVPGVLTAGSRARIDSLVAAVQRRTGGDVGIAVVPDLGGHEPVQVGVAIYRTWKIGRVDSIGSARRNLGALLLIVPKELAPDGRGHCWIASGTGAEGDLTDARAATICRERVVPRLRERDYAGAIQAGVLGIGEAFDATVAGAAPIAESDVPVRDVGPDADADRAPWWAWVIGLGLLGAGGAGVGHRIRQRRRPRPCPRGHGPMTCLDEAADDEALDAGQRTEERIRSIDYDVWACAHCDERVVIPYRRWSRHEPCPRCSRRAVSRQTVTLRAATTRHGGLEEVRARCEHCGMTDAVRRSTPRLQEPVVASPVGSSLAGGIGSGGGSSGGGGSSSSSFGGSGSTSGGGGGSSY